MRESGRALVPRLEGYCGGARGRRAADDMVVLDDRLRGEVRDVVERPDAGRAFDAVSPAAGESRTEACAIARVDAPMRLALISDIHANFEALEATFYDIAERSIDRIVCLGDIVGYNSDAAACIALIRGADCVCVAGNHDLAVCGRLTTRKFSSAAARAVAWTRQQLSADDLDFLESLPPKANIGNRVIAVHGALHPEADCASVRLDNDKDRMQSFDALMTHPSGARICAFGYTH